MKRPLLITDCDEVLLHMVSHFADWLKDAHGFHCALDDPSFVYSIKDDGGTVVPAEKVWPLLDGFFDSEMHRQSLVPGALDALTAIGDVADIVILTNLRDQHHPGRVQQLAAFGIGHRVICNQGGKGRPVAALTDTMAPSSTVFVDDLPHHHESVAQHAPGVWRLHMVAEPRIAPNLPPAPHAHARIDDWCEAKDWILERLG
jgi:hypothetical protein